MLAASLHLEWLRPAGLLLLGWLIPLWILLRRKRQAAQLATGTLDIWKQIGTSKLAAAESRSPRIPPRAWLWMLGIVAGSLAVMGPSWSARAPGVLQSFVIDRSPSMFLPLVPGGSDTRYERALQAALAALDRAGVADAARRWRSAGQTAQAGARPPAHWSQAPPAAAPELDRALYEDPSLNIVTDRARASAAGLFASGGPAIPGPLGEWQGLALEWDGQSIREGQRLPARTVTLNGALPGALRELIGIWIEQRGLQQVPDSPHPSLQVSGPRPESQTSGAESQFEASRDGWQLSGSGWALPEADFVWLRDALGAPLVSRPSPGRVTVGLQSLQATEGDPAAWAVSWSRLLDDSLLARPAEVPMAERLGAGKAVSRLAQGSPQSSASAPLAPAAWLALGCLMAALVAFFPRQAGTS